MVLEEVYLSSDIYMSCLQLALSTEMEEIICLLLGETKEENDKEQAHIHAMKIPHRMDKKKDRVEISIDQLLATQDYAEKLSQKFNKEIRVLGWFHSHPHITVWPSHVDVNTQANYQMMSSSFVGIISSVFSEDKTTKDNEVHLTCFQSESTTDDNGTVCYLRKPIPFFVVQNSPTSPDVTCLQTICELPNILYQEEKESFNKCVSEETDILSSVHNEMCNAMCISFLRTILFNEC